MNRPEMQRSLNPVIDRRSALRGTAIFAGAVVALPMMGALTACKQAAPADLTAQMPLVSAIADRIIPATDTPGALTAGVPDYIALVAQDFLTEGQRGEFAEGLGAIAERASAAGLESFEGASPEEQDALLASLTQLGEDDPARRAFRQLRALTVFGFYTSEAASQELSYEEIPGRYEACLPLADVGRAWLDRGGNWHQDWDA